MIYEAYPSYRGFSDPKRHLIFGWADSTQLWLTLLASIVALIISVVVIGEPLIALAIMVCCVMRISEIRKHAADPWYYPLRYDRHFTQFAPERPATTTVQELARFYPDDAVRTAHLNVLQRFFRRFRRESVDAPQTTRLALPDHLSPLDNEVFGVPHPPPLGWRYPTGRAIIDVLKSHPWSRAVGADVPFRRMRTRTGTIHALPDFLPWRSKPDHLTVRTKDECFIRSWRVSGGDADSFEELAIIKARMDKGLINVTPGCTIHPLVAIVPDAEELEEHSYPVEAAELVAHEHVLRQNATSRINVTVDIHLVYDARRDAEAQQKAKNAKGLSLARYQRFVGIATSFDAMLRRAWKSVEPLARTEHDDDQAQAIALPLTIGAAAPPLPGLRPDTMLSEVLGRHHLRLDLDEDGAPTGYLRLDNRLVGVYDLYDLQAQSVTPDIMRLLEGHDAPILLSLRWVACTRPEEKRELSAGYDQAVRSTEQAPSLMGGGSMPNLAAHDEANESLQLDRRAKKHQARLGYASFSIALYENIGLDGVTRARERLWQRTRALEGSLSHEQYVLTSAAPQTTDDPNDTIVVVQAMPAFFGMLPGNVRDNLLRNPMPSGILANLITSYAPWPGDPYIKEPDGIFNTIGGGSAHAIKRTTGMDRRSFAWAPQTDRRGGHTIFLADTGSGKSTEVAECVSEFLSYDNELPTGARVILLDRDGSHKIHAALHHASFLTLGDHTSLGLPVFGDPDSDEGRGLLMRTLQSMIVSRGRTFSERMRQEAEAIIERTRTLPPEQRIADNAILEAEVAFETKELLERYTSRGRCGLFNGVGDPFASRYTYVDLAPAFASDELRGPTILALMHAIEQTAKSGRGPVLLVSEEFWEILRDPQQAKMFVSWLKRLRKFGVWIWLVTHGLEDLDTLEAIGETPEALKNTIRNFVVMPSAKYYDDKLLARLQTIGISPGRARQLADAASAGGGAGEAIAEIIHANEHRMIPTTKGPIARAICGSTSEPMRKRFAEILQQHHGFIGPTFVQWIQERGGTYADRWARKAQELVDEFDALRAEAGVPPMRYDPRLFDPDISTISPAMAS